MTDDTGVLIICGPFGERECCCAIYRPAQIEHYWLYLIRHLRARHTHHVLRVRHLDVHHLHRDTTLLMIYGNDWFTPRQPTNPRPTPIHNTELDLSQTMASFGSNEP